ncbi:ankyrin repeat-containing domain protein [Podospora didyma]|uniref:Ankyrin repeat-containing domain protein n=1 Tax=Podospora didyma TaxID=330526 RepID=A0AAE0P8F6_9PEZI|nr:ankyrin repeat-containing domain protein [Podospora didyma]
MLAAIQVGAWTCLESPARSCDCSNIVGDCSATNETIRTCCIRGYQNTLACLLQINFLPQGSLASSLDCSMEVAIRRGHLQIASMLMEAGADVNFRRKVTYSPLQLAALRGNLEIVQMLLDNGQNPDLASSYTMTAEQRIGETYRPIGTSVQNTTTVKNFEVLEMLLKHGANPNATTTYLPHSALQVACRDGSLDLLALLLEYGANVNSPPARKFGATALQFAAIRGYAGIAHLLLQKEPDVNAEPAEHEGRTALEGAAEHGRIYMLQLLKNAGAHISDSPQGQYQRALRRVVNNGHLAAANLLRSSLAEHVEKCG